MFPGTGPKEVEIASRFLESGARRDDFSDAWLRRVAGNQSLSQTQVEAWCEFAPELVATLFPQLGDNRRSSLLVAWRSDPKALREVLAPEPSLARGLLLATALSIDLESDGEDIWELGFALNGKASLLHDEAAGTNFTAALAIVEEKVAEASLLVGHNLIAWDWPILSRHTNLDRPPLIWDTLLVQFLLEPQTHSHALGGSHHADRDALDAADLFRAQLDRLPPDIARGVLGDEFATSEQLVTAIARAVEGSVSYARKPPAWLASSLEDSSRLLIAPVHRLRELDWVPGAIVVSAGPEVSVRAEWTQVSFTLLEAALRDAGPGLKEDVAARTTLEVVRIADRQGIALRRNMLPLWLAEKGGVLDSAVNRSCVMPDESVPIRCAVMPDRSDWWLDTTPDAYRLAGVRQDVLVLDWEKRTVDSPGRNGASSKHAVFMHKDLQNGRSEWWLLDRAAHVLNTRGGLWAFRTMPIDPGVGRVFEATNALACKPVIAKHRFPVLYPRAEDQARYWIDVLRSFVEAAFGDDGTVPALLIVSSRSTELLGLLRTALAELELGEVPPAYRSRREQLRRAQRRSHAIVAFIDDWPAWRNEACMAGISLKPAIEALPIEEWYAATKAGLLQSSEESAEPGALTIVDASSLLERLPELLKERLATWLADLGLAESGPPTIILDPRASEAVPRSTPFAAVMPLAGLPLASQYLDRLEVVFSPFKVAREDAPEGMEVMEQFFVANWQPAKEGAGNVVSGFKSSQKQAMEAIVRRDANVLVALPTGEGKSVLFQVPALCRGLRNRRLTLVLSPLKALMHDQVERLREQGFAESVDYVNSDRPRHEIDEVMQGVLDHRIVLLYVAPERLRSRAFLDVLEKRMQSDAGLEHVVVDETHCVNQWGYEFRPDYFHALDVLLNLCRRTEVRETSLFLLLSATVTASDRARLEKILAGDANTAGSSLPLLVRPERSLNPLRSHITVQPRRVRGRLHSSREFEHALEERLPIVLDAINAARKNGSDTGQRSAVLIFVTTRWHAERVAQRLAAEVGGGIDYFHAGLDSATKDEIYESFRDGALDVLVATKAFGMGMDIPDIHWAVHLSPPGYLEDYLQEVGRIGRGVKERENARLTKLSATLLFSDADFESIRSKRAENAVSLPVIKELYSKILANAHELDGQYLSVVPSGGYDLPREPQDMWSGARRARETKVRMVLYWLERANAVKIEGSLPGILSLSLEPSVLERVTKEEGVVAEVARLILDVDGSRSTSGVPGNASSPSSAGQGAGPDYVPPLRRGGAGIFRTLTDMLVSFAVDLADLAGIKLGAASGPMRTHTLMDDPAVSQSVDVIPGASGSMVVLNLHQVILQCPSVTSMGDVLACLAELEQRDAIEINRNVDVLRRKLTGEPTERIDALFSCVRGAVEGLIQRLGTCNGRLEFNPFELVDDLQVLEADADLRSDYKRAFTNGFRTLARSSGIRLRQLVRKDEEPIWEAMLASSDRSTATRSCKRVTKGAQALLHAVGSARSIAFKDVVTKIRSVRQDKRFSERDFERAISLLSALNLLSISPELIPLSHVVALQGNGAPVDLDLQPDLWGELDQIRDMAGIRNLSMEAFARIPAEAQGRFIDGYFDVSNVDEMRAFLDAQLGEIAHEAGDEDASSPIGSMLEKLRMTKATEFFKRLEESEEPAQWEVVKAPFDRHILVNAGPGAGKTHVLVGRIVHLIREQNIDPFRIVVLAFNRAVVFEIRRRIHELFTSLGYAAYARRLRVSTFHSFAVKSLAQEGEDLISHEPESFLKTFAGRLAKDPPFAARVADGVQCVLVDEFQDMSDDVYEIIHRIHGASGTQTGITVIGDDDQDILRWQRRKAQVGSEFAEAYFDRFRSDFSGDRLNEFLLRVNFRSGREIVQRSQSAIREFFERNAVSRRLKGLVLEWREDADSGVCEQIRWEGRTWQDAVNETLLILDKLGVGQNESMAILCRSNAEVAEAHRLLHDYFPDLAVQGSATLRVADLRVTGLWLDHLQERMKIDDAVLSQELRNELVDPRVWAPGIPEARTLDPLFQLPARLWDLCCREQPFPHLSSLTRFVEQLKTDDLVRLTGPMARVAPRIVSTINKVKGLEYDIVVILPSSSRFPFTERAELNVGLDADAAEEMRLFYVGMTRAKRRLAYFRGDRECSWGRRVPQKWSGDRVRGAILVGDMKEVSLGWAMERMEGFNPDPDERQRYIESQVAVGDQLLLGGRGAGTGKALMHKGPDGRLTQVGFLAEASGKGGLNADLKVSAVVRFRPGSDEKPLAHCVRDRGWGYAVLVAGRLS